MTGRAGRRSFLLSSLGAVIALPSIGCDEHFPKTDSDTAVAPTVGQTSTAYFSNASLDSARTIGQRYLAAVAPNASSADIDALLAPTVALINAGPTDAAASAALQARVRADFGSGAILVLEGWTFATTELQLCALVSRS